jgi:hypothetical protein
VLLEKKLGCPQQKLEIFWAATNESKKLPKIIKLFFLMEYIHIYIGNFDSFNIN